MNDLEFGKRNYDAVFYFQNAVLKMIQHSLFTRLSIPL